MVILKAEIVARFRRILFYANTLYSVHPYQLTVQCELRVRWINRIYDDLSPRDRATVRTSTRTGWGRLMRGRGG